MKSLNDMYRLLYQTMKEHGQKNEPQATIVWLVANWKITTEEFTRLMLHYRSNKPTKTLHSKFYKHKLFHADSKKQDWWRYMCNDTRQQIRLFIKHMIKITRDGY